MLCIYKPRNMDLHVCTSIFPSHTHTYARMCSNEHVCTHMYDKPVFSHTDILTHPMHNYMHRHIHIYIHAYTHTSHTYVRAYIRTYVHTYTHRNSRMYAHDYTGSYAGGYAVDYSRLVLVAEAAEPLGSCRNTTGACFLGVGVSLLGAWIAWLGVLGHTMCSPSGSRLIRWRTTESLSSPQYVASDIEGNVMLPVLQKRCDLLDMPSRRCSNRRL